LAATRSIGYRTKKKATTWFNEKCKVAIENRDKAKMEVIKNNSNEKRYVLAQKQGEIKRTVRKEKIIWEEEKIRRIEEEYINSRNFFRKTNELIRTYKPKTTIMKDK